MEKMLDGSAMLTPGTYVRVSRTRGGQPEAPFIAKIVGTDMGRTKYEVGARFPGWGMWHFLDGGGWAFTGEVELITEAEAWAVPEADGA
jgi:hypothetical protein